MWRQPGVVHGYNTPYHNYTLCEYYSGLCPPLKVLFSKIIFYHRGEGGSSAAIFVLIESSVIVCNILSCCFRCSHIGLYFLYLLITPGVWRRGQIKAHNKSDKQNFAFSCSSFLSDIWILLFSIFAQSHILVPARRFLVQKILSKSW